MTKAKDIAGPDLSELKGFDSVWRGVKVWCDAVLKATGERCVVTVPMCSSGDTDFFAEIDIAANKAILKDAPVERLDPCDHEWVDARNQVIESGEICMKCGASRPGNRTSE